MVIPLSQVEYSLRKEPVAELCKSFAVRTNVVVLCTASAQAAAWVATGATLVQGKDVEAAVTRLRNSSRGNYYVFAQRFDGVDLPDDACRVLVLDGTPSGERIADTIDAARQRGSPGYSARVVNKFEQALGRAV